MEGCERRISLGFGLFEKERRGKGSEKAEGQYGGRGIFLLIGR